jgi:tetraacyldisaccharide 4'-kinase
VAHLARLLLDAGERPAILSRGYKRRVALDGVTVVSDGDAIRADLDHSGDEPLMLARAVPRAVVLVCEQRATAAALATQAFGATVTVLDDGFQHRAMPRDVDLVLIAPRDLEDRRLPFGRLREPVSVLRRADAVIVDRDDDAAAADLPRPLPDRLPVFELRRSLGAPVPLATSAPWPAKVATVVALAGIARPERFTASLARAGWTVARTVRFSDHHRYRARDLDSVREALQASGADAVLTTAKDAVRLEALGPVGLPIAAVPLQVTVEPADAFRAWLFERLSRAAGAPKPLAGGEGT